MPWMILTWIDIFFSIISIVRLIIFETTYEVYIIVPIVTGKIYFFAIVYSFRLDLRQDMFNDNFLCFRKLLKNENNLQQSPWIIPF